MRTILLKLSVRPIMSSMPDDLGRSVRDACLWLPEAEEFLSHGAPCFRVRGGKTFAMFMLNHHGDGRAALWLNAPAGAQEHHLGADPENFFIPPYVGPRGWIGLRLDKSLSWSRIAKLVREAYEVTAAPALRARIGATPRVKPPTRKPSAKDIDPMRSARGEQILKVARKICLGFPQTAEAQQFGHPCWQAGRRTFALARADDGRFLLCFWVGTLRQSLLTADSRYRIPAYMGHNGWIALDVTENCDREEIAALAEESYRHFALKRMLRAL